MKVICTILLAALTLGCKKAEQSVQAPQIVTIQYQESEADFPNPERGFYRYSETSARSYQSLNAAQLQSYRTAQPIDGAQYTVTSTLVFRYFVLEDFVNAPISDAFLAQMKTDFAVARQAGVKLIPRFAYTLSTQSGNCPEQWICAPYGDAPKAVVLQHIGQLKPLLRENADVIACLQMGFIGVWGEQYYTDYFGDASANSQGQLLDANWQDRFAVMKALLDALPTDRMIQIRIPQTKQRYVYGEKARVSSAALTGAEAYDGTDKARIGYHNDCFLSSANDFGTFEDYGNSSSPRKDANTALRNYFSSDSRYVVVGGETCSDAYSPQNDCEPTGIAEKQLSEMHYSFINAHYNNEVNNDWITGGCMANIQRKLGYRFVLKSASLPDRVSAGQALKLSLQLANVGYAAPYNPRPVQLVLRSTASGQVTVFPFPTDIRRWAPGNITLEGSFDLPASLPAGEYEVLLNLPDAYESLADRPEYGIRLANEGTWEEATGYNALKHNVVINQ
jgi:hypothetical protein